MISVALVLVFALGCGGSPTQTTSPAVGPTATAPALPVPRDKAPAAVRSAQATGPTPSVTRAAGHLREVVTTWGLDLENPWALGHALVALGPEARLASGELAIDALFARWARPAPDGIAFVPQQGDVPVEPHMGLMLKAVSDAGVSPSRTVEVAGRSAGLSQLWAHTLGHTWVRGQEVSGASFNDMPWALQGIAAWAPEGLAWRAAGHDMNIDGLTHALVLHLEEATAPIAGMRASGGPFLKRKQGVFGYTCGGAHLLQGVAHAVGLGFGEPSDRQALADQASLAQWRFDAELLVTDQALTEHPEYHRLLLVQRLKFVGHHLETMHRMSALGLIEPTGELPGHLERVRTELIRSVDQLRADGAWQQMPAVRAEREQTYLDLIGDAAHALRGLELSTGEAVVWR